MTSLDSYDRMERDLLVQEHEEHPELTTEQLLARVKQLTRPEFFRTLSERNTQLPLAEHEAA